LHHPQPRESLLATFTTHVSFLIDYLSIKAAIFVLGSLPEPATLGRNLTPKTLLKQSQHLNLEIYQSRKAVRLFSVPNRDDRSPGASSRL
jgi:hypothetical protein